MIERLRWWIAETVNKFPGQCWVGQVSWALRDPGYRFPWSRVDGQCRSDFERCGACYCGKLRGKEGGS